MRPISFTFEITLPCAPLDRALISLSVCAHISFGAVQAVQIGLNAKASGDTGRVVLVLLADRRAITTVQVMLGSDLVLSCMLRSLWCHSCRQCEQA